MDKRKKEIKAIFEAVAEKNGEALKRLAEHDFEYSFEKVSLGEYAYQVRLAGEFICYIKEGENTPEHMDNMLKEGGFDSRGDFVQYSLRFLNDNFKEYFED